MSFAEFMRRFYVICRIYERISDGLRRSSAVFGGLRRSSGGLRRSSGGLRRSSAVFRRSSAVFGDVDDDVSLKEASIG